MPSFKIAHLREQGNDMIIVPLTSDFGHKISSDQQAATSELQVRSRAAGLAGTVVPVWDAGGGKMAFIAPQQWHGFFKSISLQWVFANINKNLW